MEEPTIAALRESWDDLLQKGQELSFHKGQVLFYGGHNPYGIFVIQSGRVQFARGESRCNEGHFWHSPRGKVIGFNHFFEGTPSCCTCTATTDCHFVFISKTQLMPFLRAESG